MSNKWKLLQKETVLDRNHVRVEEWTMLTHRETKRVFEVGIFTDAVMVIAQTPKGKWILVRQYMVPVEDYRFATVAGYVESGEDPKEAAKRECKEETGYELEDLVYLGSTMRDKWETGNFHFYYGKTTTNAPGEQELEEAEDITVHEFSTDELLGLLDNNNIHDVASVACIEKALRYVLNQITNNR